MQRFLIVDDHRLFLEGMRHLLARFSSDTKVDLATSVADALRILEQGVEYDLILLDIELPGMDGFNLIQSLRSRQIMTPTIVVSSSTDLAVVRQCIEFGSLGFIHKDTSSTEMLAAIKRALAGHIVLPDAYSRQLEVVKPNQSKGSLAPASEAELGERQLEVLRLVAEGMSNKQISTVLAISEATVKYHISIIFRSLGVNNRTKCLVSARESGLI